MVLRMKQDRPQWASYTTPMLRAFGELVIGWRLMDMAVIAFERSLKNGGGGNYFKGKVYQATYFVGTKLPLTLATLETCLRDGREIVSLPANAF